MSAVFLFHFQIPRNFLVDVDIGCLFTIEVNLCCEVSLEVFRHAKCPNPLLAKDWLHGFVRNKELFVLRVLQLLLLDVGPESLYHLGP